MQAQPGASHSHGCSSVGCANQAPLHTDGFNGIALHLILSVQLKSLDEADRWHAQSRGKPDGSQKGGRADGTHLAELKAAAPPLHQAVKKKALCKHSVLLKQPSKRPRNSGRAEQDRA